MKQYELTVLFHPDLEMNLEPALAKVKKLIEENGGKITKETDEGKKRLAYQIGAQEFAMYYSYELDLPPEAPNKISGVMNITDEVLRYLLVVADPRRAKMEAKRKKEAEAQEEATEDNNKEEE